MNIYMADVGVEQNGDTHSIEQQIEQKAAAQSAKELKQEFESLRDQAEKLRIVTDRAVADHNPDIRFSGNKEDKDSQQGKASSLKELIQKIFLVAKKAPEKLPTSKENTSNQTTAVQDEKSAKLIQTLSEKIPLNSIKEETAPYLYEILRDINTGAIQTPEDLSAKLGSYVRTMRSVDPTMFTNLQQAGVEFAKNAGHQEAEAKRMFGVTESPTPDETEQARAMRTLGSDPFGENWRQYFSSYFNEGEDRTLIESLYDPKKFISYYENVQQDVATRDHISDPTEIAQKASAEMEVHISLLFAKLYAKLDHESPKEFFQSIEQEDMMRGITPVKSELKRRISHLAHDLHEYQHEYEHQTGKKLQFFRRLEEDTETAPIDVGKGNIKGRPRLKTKLVAEPSNAGEFAHYLEQITDHYIEARKYTHNSRAVFLHPADSQKGFYGQLAHFAAESSTLDFDQMMLLPDNDIFQSAFGLYNKMIEEGFAKNDWRHAATMFTPKQNEHMTQIEKRVLKQLQAMYSNRKEISEERLSAALTMAVGASRGMFLTEVEMAAHADPHLDEKGNATFNSYYNQDATPLMAFNPQHLLYRFHGGPNLLDPIFFLPVDNFKGTQAFQDHSVLWKKAALYKKSFLEGRGKLPEKTFFDMLDNIGLVGGPMQRKGWRTTWQLDSLYVSDKIDVKDKKGNIIKTHFKTNHVKTFQHFENIGYELLQDYVTKLDGDFAEVRDVHGADKRLVEQKKELFSYIFRKYFDRDPKDLRHYLDEIRKDKTKSMMDAIRKGEAAPADIAKAVEAQVSKAFLDRMLARVIVQRLPSKILRMDRDRYSKDGVSRWRRVMYDMGMEGKFDEFDAVMQDMILAEQMMRKDVSTKMRVMRDANRPPEDFGTIDYRMTPETIRALLEPMVAQKNMTPERINKVLELFGHIQKRYGLDNVESNAFIDKQLVPYFKNGGAAARESKYTIALDETDLSFIPFRGGGQSVLARSIRDIASVEEQVSKPITQFVAKLREMAINGKKDFGPIIEIMQKVYGAMDGIIGIDYANELASKLASMTIMYMKKDTQARAFMGILGTGRFNSMAAESAGKKVGVWEWDSADIDRFITAIEARGLVPGNPFNIAKPPTREPVYVNIPFVENPVRLPDKIETSKLADFFGGEHGKITIFGREITIPDIPLFTRQERDFKVWSKDLRDKFGGRKLDMFFDIVNKYLPMFVIFLLLSYIKKALDDSEGKKK